MHEAEKEQSDIIEIDGERYAIPSVIKDGKLTPSIENKIKLPIEITEGFHINRRTDCEPPPSLILKIRDAFRNWII